MAGNRFVAAVAAAFVLTAAWSMPVGAQQAEAPKFTITPMGSSGSFFDVAGKPGSTQQLSVTIRNAGAATATARTYSSDGFTTINGGLGAKLFGEPKSGTTTWLGYADESFPLDPGQSVQRPVVLTIPADASPGQHLSSLVVENAETFSAGGDVSAQQRFRQVIAVLVTVPGPVTPAFRLGAGKHSVVGKHSIVSVNLANTGNVLVKPAGPMSIKDSEGAEVAKTHVQMGSLYAGDSADLEVPLAAVLQPGDYTASWDLKDAATGAAAKGDVPFTVATAEKAQAHAAPAQTLPQVNQAVKRPVDITATTDPKPSRSRYLIAGAVVLLVLIAALVLVRRRRRPRLGD